MKPTGLFIAIEGVDGAGKETQTNLLIERLEREGYEVVGFSFPRYDESASYFVRQYLSGAYGTIDEVGPYTASLFYALDRYQASAEIRKALEEGKVVVANRFTGSNMAHHGAKFAHAEERRGFFIWLDNIEFQMLGIPRPDKNFILRMPAEVSLELIEQAGKEKDLHDENAAHIAKAVEVFDDLAQLFPKDYSRIDCVRSGSLLAKGQIHSLIWEAVSPHLPVIEQPTAPELTKTPEVLPEDERPYLSVPVGGVSGLLAQQLEGEPGLSYIEQVPGRTYDYVIPEGLDPLTETKYKAAMERIYELHTEMFKTLSTYCSHHAEPGDPAPEAKAGGILQAILPVATKSGLTLLSGRQDLADIIRRLQANPTTEAHTVAERLLTEARKLMPELEMKPTTTSNPADSPTQLQNTHSAHGEVVKLSSALPRNELDLLPHMLYESSNLSLSEIEKQIASWPIDKKIKSFQLYLSEKPGQALRNARYMWEIICDYTTFRELQRSELFEHVDAQTLTPRYGYEVPELIDDAGLTEKYEQCFDLSAKLHSVLQAASREYDAQYATLFGHRLRCKLTHDAQDLPYLPDTLQKNPELLQPMQEKLATAHPILAESITLQQY